jgi:hypothetical protein
MPIIKAGSTSSRFLIIVRDSSSSTGALLSGLTSSTVTAAYWREGASTWTTVTLVSAGGGKSLGTWTSGGFIATPRAGWYEFDIPNAAIAAGATWVDFTFYGATNMVETTYHFDLVLYDSQNAANLGLDDVSLIPATL